MRRRTVAVIAQGLAVVLPAFAAAQQPGPPIPLIPPAPSLSEKPGPSPASPEPPITSEPLASPAPGWRGDVVPPQHALPPDFWHGTPRALAEILLSRLPDTTSAALQSLDRRLLLSPAAAPEGPDAAGMSLAILRAAALLRLGEIDAARSVLAAAPDSEQSAVLRLAVAADAIAGNLDRACATVHRAVRRNQDAFWQKALISCQALAGQTAEARLGLQLLAEERLPPDTALLAAVEALAGNHPAAAITRLGAPTPLLLRLVVKARLPLAGRLIDSLSPDLALTLADDEAAASAVRLAAAERAARFGALAPARLAALYMALAASATADGEPAVMRAQRFAAIADAASIGERLARIIAFVKDFAGSQGRGLVLAARLVAPQLRDIDPNPALAGSAATAARLALAAGHDGLARRWTGLLAAAARGRLDFLLSLAMPDAASAGEEEGMRKLGAPVLRIALLAALGRPVPARAWVLLPASAWDGRAVDEPPRLRTSGLTAADQSSGAGVPLAPWLALAAVAPVHRVGETALASLLVADPGRGDPLALNAAIGGLERVGLDSDARRLAVETALAAGL